MSDELKEALKTVLAIAESATDRIEQAGDFEAIETVRLWIKDWYQ